MPANSSWQSNQAAQNNQHPNRCLEPKTKQSGSIDVILQLLVDWSHTACVRPAVHVTRPPHRTSSGRRRGELTRAPEIFQFGDVSPPNKAACPAPRVAPRPPVCRPTPPFSGGGWRAAGTPRTFLPTVVGRVVANHGQFSDFLNLIIGFSVGRARD